MNINFSYLQILLDFAIAIALLVVTLTRLNVTKQFIEFLAAIALMNMFWEITRLSIGDSFHQNWIIEIILFAVCLIPGLMLKEVIIALLVTRPRLSDYIYLNLTVMTTVVVISTFGFLLLPDVLGRICFLLAFAASLYVAWAMAKTLRKSSHRTSFLIHPKG